MRSYLAIAGVLFFLASCVSGQATRSSLKDSSSSKSVDDDLRSVRIRFEEKEKKEDVAVKSTSQKKVTVPPSDISERLDAAFDSLATRNLRLKGAQGYRITIYSGNKNDEAALAKEKAHRLVSGEKIYIVYNQPVFRVKVGNYYDRLEAHYYLTRLKKEFPNALVIPDQVFIRD